VKKKKRSTKTHYDGTVPPERKNGPNLIGSAQGDLCEGGISARGEEHTVSAGQGDKIKVLLKKVFIKRGNQD